VSFWHDIAQPLIGLEPAPLTETDAKPLSDERIARRTVAKHRAILGIEHAHQRRRAWAMNL